MREAEFRDWLAANYEPRTIETQVSRVRRIEQAYGDLDELHGDGGLGRIVEELRYSSADARAGRANPSKLAIDGDLRTNLASYRSTVGYYLRFLASQGEAPDRTEQQALVAALDEAAVEAAMDRCDELGLEAFLREFGFARPQRWVLGKENGQRYPAKAIVAVALGYLAGGRLLAASEYFGGFGEAEAFRRLGELGFEVTSNDTGVNLTVEAVEAAMDEYDRLGSETFMSRYGFGVPRDHWVLRPGSDRRYPAKAIMGVAHQYLPGGQVLQAGEFYGGEGSRAANGVLRALGFEIVSGTGAGGSEADRIRDFIIGTIVEPARRRGENSVEVISGDVHRSMGLTSAMPSVCQVMDGRRLAEAANIRIVSREGPHRSSTVRIRYALDPASPDDTVQEFNRSDFKGQLMSVPTNLILYGPPGTGKTHATGREAVLLCDGSAPTDRAALMARYEDLRKEGRIAFVTFHQSFSYEDFVEGLRPAPIETEEGASSGFQLKPEEGVFARMANKCLEHLSSPEGADELATETDLTGRRFFKLSLGEANRSSSDWVYEDSLRDGYALFSYGCIDWRDDRFAHKSEILREAQTQQPGKAITALHGVVKCTHAFRNDLQIGDVLVVAKGLRKFRAIGIVDGDYEYHPRPEGNYCHRRKVRWLWRDDQGVALDRITPVNFNMDPIYQIGRRDFLDVAQLQRLVDTATPRGDADQPDVALRFPQPHVLIIDEINRANISKVFGELITLIEPDKRLDMANALTVRLPYSKRDFGVPANLHLIGTMNTADRSIALLDTALRRRFRFKEIAPDPTVLPPSVAGIPLRRVLDTINQRIEYLIDREHRIGHAFFMGEDCATRAGIDAAMRDKVIPLLQEYFFEDWSRIHAVLGGGFIGRTMLKPPPGLEGLEEKPSWFVREPFRADAYDILVGKVAAPPEADAPDEPTGLGDEADVNPTGE